MRALSNQFTGKRGFLVEVINLHLSWFVNQLKNNKPFTFARYGDGEWLTILGFYGMHNSNGCTFTEELSRDMRNGLLQQHPYHHAILKIAMREKEFSYRGKMHTSGGIAIEAWLKENNITLPWYNGDVLLEESLKGKLFPLVEQVREKNVLYVGNRRLRDLNMRGVGFFPYTAYIQIPPRDTHKEIDSLLYEIYRTIRKYKIDFIGWSAGLAGKVMIDEVYTRFPEVTQIDFGSLFDAYFRPMENVNPLGSRSYIRKGNHNWKALLAANTGQLKEPVFSE